VPDALAAVPGLNVVQSGGPGGQTSVFMRGTNSNHVKVLVDGIDVSDPSNPNGSFDLGQLLTGDVARIEVLRGPQSGLYGSDAIGGVISITTKSGSGPPKLTVSTEGGSFGTTNERASLSGSQADFNYVFNVQHFQAASTPVTPNYDLAPGEKRNNDFYDNWTYSTKLGAKVSDTLAFNVVGRYTDSKLHFTGDVCGFFSNELRRTNSNYASRPSIFRSCRSRVDTVRRIQELLRRGLFELVDLELGPQCRYRPTIPHGSPADGKSRNADQG
jgi:vitamin B12 transporter